MTKDSTKQGYLFYQSRVIMMTTQVLFTNFCVLGLNPPTPSIQYEYKVK